MSVMSKKLGKSKAVEYIEKCAHDIQDGVMLCIDPSVGSSSSMPGYAIYENSALVDAGILEITSAGQQVPYRLRELSEILRTEFKGPWDVVVIEDIPPMRGGPFANVKGHASLLKSCGAIIAATSSPHIVEMHPTVWRRYIDDEYVKSDHMDAIYIGKAALGMAQLIIERERLRNEKLAAKQDKQKTAKRRKNNKQRKKKAA